MVGLFYASEGSRGQDGRGQEKSTRVCQLINVGSGSDVRRRLRDYG